MCATCGCGLEDEHHHDHHHHHHHAHSHAHGAGHEHETRRIKIERALLAKNSELAEANRRGFEIDGVAVFNLIGSPGAGKTALLEATIGRLALPMAVLEGDQATDLDARRIERAGARVVQINTGTGCHLDASMVADGMDVLGHPRHGVIFVENVGNLVCPALFDLGERAKVVVMAVTEGEDKPLKYPHVFRAASALVLTKVDLLPHVPFDVGLCLEYARQVQPELTVFRVSSLIGEGMDPWCRWIGEAAEVEKAS
jgi:hydrogenase nickel incorporation protein HypB